MSIQLAAKHLAAHGRGPDTTLVHMTPAEVASLQSLAQQHGGSLSINPQTGLPEAGFLSALLPMAAGAALTTMGMPAGYAALTVGAASAATNGGDLRKGMMAGISAYGGAGMAESFMGAGLGTMGGAMGTSAAEAAPTVLATPAGATSPYALTGSTSAAPSAAKYSLGDPSSYLNKPLPSLVSTAPAEVARAAAAATPAAQQASALSSMDIGQRFNALKAGATGTNAMNYIKANPFTSLGVATAAMTPDENNTPQKAADTDRGPRAKLQYYSGYGTSLPAPNMQGIEQTYNRPYYAAEGGVTRMATGGITSAPRNQQQLFAEYLQRVSSSGVAAPPPTNKYDWWKNSNDPAPAAPAETAEEYAARMSLNARGGGGGGGRGQGGDEASESRYNPTSPMAGTESGSLGFQFLDAYGRVPFLPGSSVASLVSQDMLTKELEQAGKNAVKAEADARAGYAKGTMFGAPPSDPSTFGGAGYGVPSTRTTATGAGFPANPMSVDPAQAGKALRDYSPSELAGVSMTAPADFGLSSSNNNDSVGRGVFGYNRTDNDDSVGRGVFGYNRTDNFNPAAEAEARTAANTAAMTAETRDRINAMFEASERANREAEAKAADAVMERQTTLDRMARDADEAEKEAANQAVLDAARAAADVPLGEGFVSPSASSLPAGIDITPSVPGAISADPDADKKTEALGIPSAKTFAAMIGSPFAQTAAFNTGVVSDVAPNMGIQGAGLGGIGGFGGFGYSPSDNNDSVGRGDFGGNFGGDFGGDFGYSVSDNTDSVGRSDGNDGGSYGGGDYGSGSAADGGGRDSDGSPYARGGEIHGGLPNPYNLGSYSDGGRLLKGPGDGVSDSIPATIGKGRPARLADGEFVIPARIVSEIGNGSTDAGARKLYAMMDRIQAGRKKSVGKGKVAVNSRAYKHLPA